jgi:hypothetical protein
VLILSNGNATRMQSVFIYLIETTTGLVQQLDKVAAARRLILIRYIFYHVDELWLVLNSDKAKL